MKRRGVLSCLPSELELPFYPYSDDHDDVENRRGMLECGIGKRRVFPLESGGFTLFLFVDFACRHSTRALRVVSEWLHHAGTGREICICVPNQIYLHDTFCAEDLMVKSSASYARRASKQKPQFLRGTGFFHLPITQKHRATLVRVLNATCAPSVIVVNNSNGRIASKWGWEAICRERKSIETWSLNRRIIEKEKAAYNSDGFSSKLLVEWQEGRSGLPCWWWLWMWFL